MDPIYIYYGPLTHFAVMLPSLLVVVPPFARDVGAEPMTFEPLNPYTVMHRISFQAGSGRCRLSFKFTPSGSMKGEEEVGGLSEL
jgi:hypothetical protein